MSAVKKKTAVDAALPIADAPPPASPPPATSCAAEIEALKAELSRAVVEADNAKTTLAVQVEGYNAAIQEKVEEANALKARVAKLEAELAKLRNAPAPVTAAAKAEPEAEGLVEVVAVPPNPSVKIPPMTYRGKRVEMKTDADGFVHFLCPRPLANELLTDISGVKYLLVGPDDKMTVTQRRGCFVADITVYRHVLAKYPTGGAFWQPVIVEETEGKA